MVQLYGALCSGGTRMPYKHGCMSGLLPFIVGRQAPSFIQTARNLTLPARRPMHRERCSPLNVCSHDARMSATAFKWLSRVRTTNVQLGGQDTRARTTCLLPTHSAEHAQPNSSKQGVTCTGGGPEQHPHPTACRPHHRSWLCTCAQHWPNPSPTRIYIFTLTSLISKHSTYRSSNLSSAMASRTSNPVKCVSFKHDVRHGVRGAPPLQCPLTRQSRTISQHTHQPATHT